MFRLVRAAVFASILVMSLSGRLSAREGLTAHDVARTRYVSSAVIAPDGSAVAYVLQVCRDPLAKGVDASKKYEDGPNWAELHVYRLPDGPAVPFVTGETNVESVAWKPDSRALSFLSKRGKDKQKSLYVICADGGEAERAVAFPTDISAYSWSPDGRCVAFLAAKEDSSKRKECKERGFTAEIYEEEEQDSHIWIASLDAAKDEPRLLDLPGSVSALSWSPTGNLLLAAIAPTPLIDDEYMKRKVSIVDCETGAITRQFDNPGKLGSFVWSPDGNHVAVNSAADIHDPSDGRLTVASVAEGKLDDVLPGLEGHISSAAWQDADTVMFLADEGLKTQFGKVDVNKTGRRTLIPHGEVVFSDMTLSRDGQKAAFVGSSAKHPSELFLMNHGESGPRRVTDSNPWLAEVPLAKQEGIRFKARDGVELEGVLFHPLREERRILYPLILCVHGGPESHERDGWLTTYSRPGQVASAAGYFTFYPNYRGSTGRGVEFSKLGQGDEAGKEFDDLVDAVDFLVGKYPIDKAKVGVTGGSYGGYAAAWCATKFTERFAASVMFVGISDTISKKGTTDIPNEDYLVHTRARPWEENKWMFFLERSPIYHVANAKTPILILGGKNDTRVHPSQSMELYRFLKTIGKAPVRYVRYPGEGHGNRKAALKLDYNLRTMQWFDHYLKGPGGNPPPAVIEYGLEKPSKNGTQTTTRPA